MKTRCPGCGKETEYQGNPFRPFCSERCKIIDLGRWASGDYRMPAGPADAPDGKRSEGSDEPVNDEK